jgi:CelD/BcsL family acetyltransferase involved in cellulose biosynthesis
MMSSAWDTFPESMSAVASATGPFTQRAFLEAVHRVAPNDASDVGVTATATGAVALVTDEHGFRFAGTSDLTDYHSPLGVDAVATMVQALEGTTDMKFRLDSMPAEARDVVAAALAESGATFSIDQHEVAAVLTLPETFDEWLVSIGKKERHEVRRKRRRFISEFGDIEVVEGGLESFATFAELHRSSAGSKGSFMTEEMEGFFQELLTHAGATIHSLVCHGRTVAAAFGFEHGDGYYFYNSAYDPGAAMASPGVVLFATMIEHQINRGATIFDFLKGDEQYKFRHGAIPRPLFAASGVMP